MMFTDLQLPPDLIAALSKQQINEPTPVQSVAIPVLLSGKDAYLHAETGTGKTLAYLLPLMMRIDSAQSATQVVEGASPSPAVDATTPKEPIDQEPIDNFADDDPVDPIDPVDPQAARRSGASAAHRRAPSS